MQRSARANVFDNLGRTIGGIDHQRAFGGDKNTQTLPMAVHHHNERVRRGDGNAAADGDEVLLEANRTSMKQDLEDMEEQSMQKHAL